MAQKKTADTRAQYAAMVLTESGANTLTTAKFQFPFSIMDKMALIIHRIEYEIVNVSSVFAASADRLTLAIIAANTIVDITNPVDPTIIDSCRFGRYDFGAAASGFVFQQPYVKDFTNLPGGGIMVAPNPLYYAAKGDSAGAASVTAVRMYYTYEELATDDYWQLVESRRIITS